MSTLHTNDSAGAITRLLEMGVEEYLLASTINAILAQRLVRTLCPDCREPHPYADALVERFDLHRLATSGTPTPHACAWLPKLPGQRLARPDHDHRLLVMTDRMRAAAMARGETGKLAEL